MSDVIYEVEGHGQRRFRKLVTARKVAQRDANRTGRDSEIYKYVGDLPSYRVETVYPKKKGNPTMKRRNTPRKKNFPARNSVRLTNFTGKVARLASGQVQVHGVQLKKPNPARRKRK